MHPRIAIAKFLLKLGRFIKSSAVVVMRPNELIEFSRQYYAKHSAVLDWSDEQFVNSGLNSQELSILDKTNINKGRLLLLGIGGGREAIPLVKMGFEVTGVDFIPKMVERAKENVRKNGVEIIGLVQEISKLDLTDNAYDVVWLSSAMYSCVPTRNRRVDMLKRISKALKPGGVFVFGFLWIPSADTSATSVLLRKTLAWVTLGNLHYEKGDTLRFDREFIHAFTNVDDLKAEMIQGGFEPVDIQLSATSEFANAMAKKSF